METDHTFTFTSVLEKFDSNLWGYHLSVPEAIARMYIESNNRRVVATLNDAIEFQCALMPKGDGSFFININKKIRDTLKLKIGATVAINLRKDDSKYGLPMPEELDELLQLDEEGNRLFHALTPGKQRNLLYIVGAPRTSDTRIARAIVVVDHLKGNHGKIDFKQLYQALKVN